MRVIGRFVRVIGRFVRVIRRFVRLIGRFVRLIGRFVRLIGRFVRSIETSARIPFPLLRRARGRKAIGWRLNCTWMHSKKRIHT